MDKFGYNNDITQNASQNTRFEVCECVCVCAYSCIVQSLCIHTGEAMFVVSKLIDSRANIRLAAVRTHLRAEDADKISSGKPDEFNLCSCDEYMICRTGVTDCTFEKL